jgi:hypothetical protein
MFNTISYKGNANQNYTKILSHSSQNGNHQEKEQQIMARMPGRTPGDIPKVMQHRLLQRHLHTHVYCSTIHNSQVMETTKMSHY